MSPFPEGHLAKVLGSVVAELPVQGGHNLGLFYFDCLDLICIKPLIKLRWVNFLPLHSYEQAGIADINRIYLTIENAPLTEEEVHIKHCQVEGLPLQLKSNACLVHMAN